MAPPLPPRKGADQAAQLDPPPAYSIDSGATKTDPNWQWPSQDPRTSSQESLHPPHPSERHGRRKLLAVFIHGFMGNETSFRSFPAHLHNLLTVILAETHVIHTKIYPRYRSKRNISFARDDFSKWLEVHEGEAVDVILLGHSMGGLLAAEVVTMKGPAEASAPMKHRILGNINFDVPFLGMSPSIIKSGLASIFRSDETPPADKFVESQTNLALLPEPNPGSSPTRRSSSATSGVDALWTPTEQDPNFNPKYANDVVLPTRTGWQNAWHFVNKHSKDLMNATKQLVSSHMEFGGAMANYPELKMRYGRIRILEEENADVRRSLFDSVIAPRRVRFVNYYTACTGRPKKISSKKTDERDEAEPENTTTGDADASTSSAQDTDLQLLESESACEPSSFQISINAVATTSTIETREKDKGKAREPTKEMTHNEKEEIRLEKEQERMAAESRRLRGESEQETRSTSPDCTSSDLLDHDQPLSPVDQQGSSTTDSLRKTTSSQAASTASDASTKPIKERRFCTLPPQDSNGNLDPCWIKILMRDVDEVGAHCGLFFVDERYEKLVGEVATKIEEWIRVDADLRLATEFAEDLD